MNNSIQLVQQDSNLTTEVLNPSYSVEWMNYFDIHAALRDWKNRVMKLPGANTPEAHTWTSYSRALFDFLRWGHALARGAEPTDENVSIQTINQFFDHMTTDNAISPISHPLPSPGLIERYIVHLKQRATGGTINTKYLASIRHYMRAITNLEIDIRNIQHLTEYMQITEWRESMRRACEIKASVIKKTSQSALFANGTRLKLDQVNATLRHIDRTTLAGKRDYALLLTAFSSGLRVSELSRMTLSSIEETDTDYIITVRGKRGNMDPVPIGTTVNSAIQQYVNAYNDAVNNDHRRITGDASLWRQIKRNDKPADAYTPADNENYVAGMSLKCLSAIIKNRVSVVTVKFSAHDTRRTCAYLAYKAGMSLANIRQLLRHSSLAVTAIYIGVEPDYTGFTLSRFISIG